MNAATWFLVWMAGQQYIGPLPETACQKAAVELQAQGVVCKQASTMMGCDVPNRPGSYMACPVFNFPHVTVKPKSNN
jgi:hypothetical protein